MKKKRKDFLSKEVLLLFLLFVLALSIRLLFSTGSVIEGNLTIVRNARSLSMSFPDTSGELFSPQFLSGVVNQMQTIRAEKGFQYVLLLLPYASSYYFFGFSESAGLIYPLTISLISMGIVYLIGKFIGNSSKAGLISALFWALSPYDIYLSSTISLHITIIFVYLITVLLFFLTFDVKSLLAGIFATGFLLVLLVLYPLLAFSLLFWLTLWILHSKKPNAFRRIAFGLAAILLVSAIIFPAVAQSSIEFIGNLFDENYSLIFFPVFILAVSITPWKKQDHAFLLLAWIGISFLLSVISDLIPVYPEFVSEFRTDLVFSLFLIPCISLASILVAKPIKNKELYIVLAIDIVVMIILGSLNRRAAIWGVNLSVQEAYWGDMSSKLMKITEGVAFLFLLLTPFVLKLFRAGARSWILLSLITALAFASLSLATRHQLPIINNTYLLNGAIDYLSNNRQVPIYVTNRQMQLILEYLPQFKGLMDSSGNPLVIDSQILPRILQLDCPCLILTWEDQFIMPLIAEYQKEVIRFVSETGQDLVIYQVNNFGANYTQ